MLLLKQREVSLSFLELSYGLIQMDASSHDWFEGRGSKCALRVAIDDATSKIMGLHFEPTESLDGYFNLLRSLLAHSINLSFFHSLAASSGSN